MIITDYNRLLPGIPYHSTIQQYHCTTDEEPIIEYTSRLTYLQKAFIRMLKFIMCFTYSNLCN